MGHDRSMGGGRLSREAGAEFSSSTGAALHGHEGGCGSRPGGAGAPGEQRGETSAHEKAAFRAGARAQREHDLAKLRERGYYYAETELGGEALVEPA